MSCGNCREHILLCVMGIVGKFSVLYCGNCREQIVLCVLGIVGKQ